MDLLVPSTPFTPFTPLIIKDCAFDFDAKSGNVTPDDNNTLTPLLQRINASPKLWLTPKSLLRQASQSTEGIAAAATTPTTINGRLAPPSQLQQHYSNSPQRRGSPLVDFRRLRSSPLRLSPAAVLCSQLTTTVPTPPPSSLLPHLEVPKLITNNKSKACTNSKDDSKSKSNLAERRRCRQLRIKQELQRRYDKPFEIHAVAHTLSPRVDYLLRRVGMIRYRSLFQMKEIDFIAFRSLNKNDLQALGVDEADDREEIYKAVQMADLLVMEQF